MGEILTSLFGENQCNILPSCADELFQTSHQLSGDTIQDVPVSEQDNAEKSPGHVLSQKGNPQSLAYEPETGKLLKTHLLDQSPFT